MTLADADFVLGANHAVGLYAAQFALLDGKLLVAVVEFGTQCGDNHLLTGLDVGGAADNLFGLALSEVYGADVHVVAVGMRFAGQHFANDDALQTSPNALYFLHAVHFQPDAGQCLCHFIGRKVEIDVLAEPFIRNIHAAKLRFTSYLFLFRVQRYKNIMNYELCNRNYISLIVKNCD